MILHDGYVARLKPTRLAAISRYVLPLGKAHPLNYLGLLWTAPLLSLAFEGALLPLSMQQPALSPLLKLPKRIAPRNEWLRVLPTLIIKSDAKLLTFIVIQHVKELYLTLFLREGLARRRG